jgi:hypothetical protein
MVGVGNPEGFGGCVRRPAEHPGGKRQRGPLFTFFTFVTDLPRIFCVIEQAIEQTSIVF